MAFLTTLGLIAGGVSAAQQFISGASASQRAKRGLEEFEFQDLSVGAFDEFKPSLALEEQQLESIERQRARVADVAAGLGASEAMALLSQTEQQLTGAEQQAQARKEQLTAEGDILRGRDLQQRVQMIEQRGFAELQSLQQEMAAGQQMMASGLGDLAQLAVSAGLSQDLSSAGLSQDLSQVGKEREPKTKNLTARDLGVDRELKKRLIELGLHKGSGVGSALRSLGGLFKKQ